MTMAKYSSGLDDAIDAVVGMLVAEEPDLFIATEFMISTELLRALKKDSPFSLLLAREELALSKSGFDWWQPSDEFKRLIARLRATVAESASRPDQRLAIRAAIVGDVT